MGRTVTLRGEAAGAFVRALQNKPAVSEDDKYERVVAYILANGNDGTKSGMYVAKLAIKSVVENGIDETLKRITGEPAIETKPPAKKRSKTNG